MKSISVFILMGFNFPFNSFHNPCGILLLTLYWYNKILINLIRTFIWKKISQFIEKLFFSLNNHFNESNIINVDFLLQLTIIKFLTKDIKTTTNKLAQVILFIFYNDPCLEIMRSFFGMVMEVFYLFLIK